MLKKCQKKLKPHTPPWAYHSGDTAQIIYEDNFSFDSNVLKTRVFSCQYK